MSFPVRSPARPDDDLDGLLRAFFQAELPRPWPALKAPPTPHPAVAPLPVRRGLFRSRLALAASVALLVTGALTLPGRFAAPTEPGLRLRNAEATRTQLPSPQPKVRLHFEQRSDRPTEIRADVTLDDLGGLPPSR